MTNLFSYLNVDLVQLKILVRTAIRSSFRGYEGAHSDGDRSIRSGFRNMLITYFITSIALCAMASICGNQLTYNTLLISYGMMMTAFAVLIEYNDLILNADDGEILFSRPITSETLFWARLMTLALFVLLYSASLLLLPSLASFKFAVSKLYFMPLAFIIMMTACLVSALVVVFFYVQLLRHFRPSRLIGLLSYFQGGFSLVLFYVYYKFLLYKAAEGEVSIARAVQNVQTAASVGINPFRLTVDQSPYFHFLPPAWFAKAIGTLLGDTSSQSLGLASMAILASGLAVFMIVKGVPACYLTHLTVLHSEASSYRKEAILTLGTIFKLGRSRRHGQALRGSRVLSSASAPILRVRSTPMLLPSFLAGYNLVGRYLKRDGRLRRGILPFFGIILFYFLYALENDYFLIDIFQAESTLDVLGAHPVYVLLPICVLIATNATKYCSDWKAAWIFFIAPMNLPYFHLGHRLATLNKIYGPIWLMMFLFYAFKVQLTPLLMQMFAMFLIVLLLTSLSFLFDPHVPLSQPPRLHAGFLRFTFVMVFLVAIAQVILAVEYKASQGGLTMFGFYLALVIGIVLGTFLELSRLKQVRPANY